MLSIYLTSSFNIFIETSYSSQVWHCQHIWLTVYFSKMLKTQLNETVQMNLSNMYIRQTQNIQQNNTQNKKKENIKCYSWTRLYFDILLFC